MRTLQDVDLTGKRVLLRVDVNSPIEQGRVMINPRFRAHAQTIRLLSAQGCKLILLAHQGRRGERDFTTLEQHARLLEGLVGIKIRFVSDVAGDKATEAIARLESGQILLLDNVRHLEDEETHTSESRLVKTLAPLADLFIMDAFSIAHRRHASVVGFVHALPCYPGPVLSDEIEAVDKANRAEQVTFVIGGSKIHDAYLILKRWLAQGKVERVLVSGVPGILCVYAKGENIGKSHGMLTHSHLINEMGEVKELMQQYGHLVQLPMDFGVERNGERHDVPLGGIDQDQNIKDIGKSTMEIYARHIRHAKAIIMNGSPGVYEEPQFGQGTRAVLEAIAQSSAFSLIGGGHTITAIEKFGIPKEKFGYISLAGKAFLEYLEGKELVALKALEENAGKKF